jgi:hypothetical protein
MECKTLVHTLQLQWNIKYGLNVVFDKENLLDSMQLHIFRG